jgi:S-adenosylmethionine synthetase
MTLLTLAMDSKGKCKRPLSAACETLVLIREFHLYRVRFQDQCPAFGERLHVLR